jgi:hypothetical protein
MADFIIDGAGFDLGDLSGEMISGAGSHDDVLLEWVPLSCRGNP